MPLTCHERHERYMAKIYSEAECLATHRQKDKERKNQQRERNKENLTEQQKDKIRNKKSD